MRLVLIAAALAALPLAAVADPDPATRVEIEQILAQMNQDLDAEEYDAYVSVWADDAVFETGISEPVIGVDAVMDYLRQNQAAGFITGKRHFISNLTLEHAGGNVIASYYLAVFEREVAPALVATAFITDEFAVVDGEWRIVHHVTSIDPAMMNAMGGDDE